jgi:hypothetical protein
MANDASHMLRGQPGNPGQFAGSVKSPGDAELGPVYDTVGRQMTRSQLFEDVDRGPLFPGEALMVGNTGGSVTGVADADELDAMLQADTAAFGGRIAWAWNDSSGHLAVGDTGGPNTVAESVELAAAERAAGIDPLRHEGCDVASIDRLDLPGVADGHLDRRLAAQGLTLDTMCVASVHPDLVQHYVSRHWDAVGTQGPNYHRAAAENLSDAARNASIAATDPHPASTVAMAASMHMVGAQRLLGERDWDSVSRANERINLARTRAELEGHDNASLAEQRAELEARGYQPFDPTTTTWPPHEVPSVAGRSQRWRMNLIDAIVASRSAS